MMDLVSEYEYKYRVGFYGYIPLQIGGTGKRISEEDGSWSLPRCHHQDPDQSDPPMLALLSTVLPLTAAFNTGMPATRVRSYRHVLFANALHPLTHQLVRHNVDCTLPAPA